MVDSTHQSTRDQPIQSSQPESSNHGVHSAVHDTWGVGRELALAENSVFKTIDSLPGLQLVGHPHQTPKQDMLTHAKQDVGQPLWDKNAYDISTTQHGNFGCAASVSAVVRQAQHSHIDQVSVIGLSDQLEHDHWQPHSINDAKPGDVIIGLRSPDTYGPGAHTGIVGPNGTEFDNGPKDKWEQGKLSAWNTNNFPYRLYTLSPPSS